MSDKDIIDMKEENGQWSAYVSEFSPEKLWEKIKGHAKKVGCEGIRSALRLFYALDNPSMPLKTKMVIYGALGYFIFFSWGKNSGGRLGNGSREDATEPFFIQSFYAFR